MLERRGDSGHFPRSQETMRAISSNGKQASKGGLLAFNLRQWWRSRAREGMEGPGSCKASDNGGETQGTLPAVRRTRRAFQQIWQGLLLLLERLLWPEHFLPQGRLLQLEQAETGSCGWQGDSGHSLRHPQRTASYWDAAARIVDGMRRPGLRWCSRPCPPPAARESNFRPYLK